MSTTTQFYLCLPVEGLDYDWEVMHQFTSEDIEEAGYSSSDEFAEYWAEGEEWADDWYVLTDDEITLIRDDKAVSN